MKNRLAVPRQAGQPVDSGEAEAHLRRRKPYLLGVTIPSSCDLRCVYCARTGKEFARYGLQEEDIRRAVNEFVALGGKHVWIEGDGEPFLRGNKRYTMAAVDAATESGIDILVFTNMRPLNRGLCNSLLGKSISITGKLVSLDEKTQNRLCPASDSPGYGFVAYGKWTIPEKLLMLMQAGFNQATPSRLGVDVIMTRENLRGIPDVVEFCLENNIYPELEPLVLKGRAVDNRTALMLDKKDREWLYREIERRFGAVIAADLDRYGRGKKCPVLLAGIFFDGRGEVKACSELSHEDIGIGRIGSIREDGLREIWERLLALRRYPELVPEEGTFNACPASVLLHTRE